MTLDPLLAASPLIQFHAVAAIFAVLLGPVVILRRQRDFLHRFSGYVWIIAMVATAVSASGIFEIRLIGPLSPIHALSGLVVVMLWLAVRAIRAGKVMQHGRIMTQLYIWSMGVAGLFTLMPGRRMHHVLMDGAGWTGFWIAACFVLFGVAFLWRAQPGYVRCARVNFPLFKGRASR